MTNRNPNEVLIARMLLEQLLSEGGPRLFSDQQRAFITLYFTSTGLRGH